MSPEPNVFSFPKSRATVTTADLMPGFYKAIDPNVQFADATRLPFADNAFELVIANHIMEHIPNDLLALRELYRVLQPGGIAVLQVPFSETIPDTLEEPDIQDPQKQSALFGQKEARGIRHVDDHPVRRSVQRSGAQVAAGDPGEQQALAGASSSSMEDLLIWLGLEPTLSCAETALPSI